MAVKIRLARHGRTNLPFYWIVLCESSSSRDGRFLKKLGTYNPFLTSEAKVSIMDLDSIKHYMACGAQTTPTVARLFKLINLSTK